MDPRNITSRHPTYLSKLGPYISEFEHHLRDAPWLVKGLTIPQRDAKMTALIGHKYYFKSDYSRFDRHVSLQALDAEHAVYMKWFNQGELWDLLRAQRSTFIYHACGLIYSIVGTRCSGDANTSIGNALLNRAILRVAFHDLKIDWVGFHEGDDGVGAFDTPLDVSIISQHVSRVAKEFGFTLDFEIVTDIRHLYFCGRYLLDDCGRLLSYCDLRRFLDKFTITATRRSATSEELQSLLLAKAQAYLATDSHVPIVSEICKLVVRVFGHLQPRYERDTIYRLSLGGVSPVRSLAGLLAAISETSDLRVNELSLRRDYYNSLTSWPATFELVTFSTDRPAEDVTSF